MIKSDKERLGRRALELGWAWQLGDPRTRGGFHTGRFGSRGDPEFWDDGGTDLGVPSVPDVTTDAGRGRLLGMVREAWGCEHLGISFETWSDGEEYWSVGCDYEFREGICEVGTGDTETEALLDALERARA